jgi:hypothetical protein
MTFDVRYPLGTYHPQPFSSVQKGEWLADIRFLPQRLEAALHDLDEAQLHTPYREGGWTVHQLVHHIADSHINAYCRFKLGFTEEIPTIKTYDEKAWAQTADVTELPVNISITLLFALHQRWYSFLQSFTDRDWQRTIYHPEHQREITLWHLVGMYAWHGRHHVAHITAMRERMAW